MQDLIQDFLDSMARDGCAPADMSMPIVPDDKWHYYTLAGDVKSKKAGAYSLCIEDDFGFGCYLNRRSGDVMGWHSKSDRQLTKDERTAINDKIALHKVARQKELEAGWDNTRGVVEFEFSISSPADMSHPYLAKKGLVPDSDIRILDGDLMIPMKDINGVVWSYQVITQTCFKHYRAGGKVAGCFYGIGEPKDRVIICEGWATGKTLSMACDIPVRVAFDAGKMLSVARETRKALPNAQIILVGDNDAWRTDQKGNLENIGAIKAEQAALDVGGHFIIPHFKPESLETKPTDFDDLRLIEGLDAVTAQLAKITDFKRETIVEVTPFEDKIAPKQEVLKNWEDLVVVKAIDRSGAIKEIKDISVNYYTLIRHYPSMHNMFKWDDFSKKVIVANAGSVYPAHCFEPHVLTDDCITKIDMHLQKLGIGINGSEQKTRTAIYQAAFDDPFNPIKDHFDSLVWDGESRLDSWLAKYCGAKFDDAGYVSTVGRTWMVAAVARVYDPGCKFDHMMILEGGQGLGKSTALKMLADVTLKGDEEYFTDAFSMKKCTSPDELSKLRGKFIVECAELTGMNKADRDEMTNFITQTRDTYRSPYGREMITYPRTFVLAGTNNPVDGIFTDPTGYRRFWCVKCSTFNTDELKLIRTQLWAEAVHLYKSGYSLYQNKEFYELAERQGRSRIVQDDWRSVVLDYCNGKEFVTTKDILTDALKFELKYITRKESSRVNKILAQEKFTDARKRVGKTQVWGWQNPEYVEQEIEF